MDRLVDGLVLLVLFTQSLDGWIRVQISYLQFHYRLDSSWTVFLHKFVASIQTRTPAIFLAIKAITKKFLPTTWWNLSLVTNGCQWGQWPVCTTKSHCTSRTLVSRPVCLGFILHCHHDCHTSKIMHKLTLTLLVATYLQYLNITKSLLATIDITISKKQI